MDEVTLFRVPTRRRPAEPNVDYLTNEALEIIDRAYSEHLAYEMLPLFSGGNDSMCSTFVASLHPGFKGTVYSIDTGIAVQASVDHLVSACRSFGWELDRRKSEDTYEAYVAANGFPGPGRHQYIYNRIKDRCVRVWVKESKSGGQPVGLLTGCRRHESSRRMGHVAEIKRGSSFDENAQRIRDPYQLWVAPIAHWTKRDCAVFMEHHGLPRNPTTPWLGMSGECCCGAYATPDELDRIRKHAPEVAKEIDRLAEVAKASGLPCKWGEPPDDQRTISGATGPLCHGCDRRMSLFSDGDRQAAAAE
jgi:3'-phosphoadenosine 5'-phosphosulfate sulfotransferase (PAPS reductase)/FAD synthetase